MTTTEPTGRLLEVSEIQLRYGNGAVGVSDVSLTVDAGQVVALIGPNGAGKTSTVRSISGFLPIEGAKVARGRVTLDGEDVTNSSPHQLSRHGIAFVPERQKIFPNLTIRDNLLAVGHAPGRAERAAREKHVFELFPELADRVREQAGRLSGGQRQMLALARAVMSSPRLLIVDEMTLGLHHSLQPRLFRAVRQMAQSGTAVILVDESTGLNLDVADYCYLIGGGVVRAEGPPQLLRDGDVIANVYVEG
ncbi:MAG: hypothetical protein ABS81_09660 [Pseudonocardia sp. SCN 72-86]|nr:MAG: hypothetical protein ABS81_09660 [Pseudonocardia sp. SCN 72-86]